jgi:hypothetical protein
MTRHTEFAIFAILLWIVIACALAWSMSGCAAHDPLLTKEERYYRQQWADPNLEHRLSDAVSQETNMKEKQK